MNSTDSKNLIIFTSVSSIWGIIFGFIGPFYVVYVQQLTGGMEKLGIAFSIMIFLQSFTTYLAGRYSDKLGRKPFLIVTAYADAAILFFYTVITQTSHVYLLQGLLGITNGINGTIRTSLLGDLTIKEKRGSIIGRFDAIVSFSSAIGLALSGYLVKFYGLKFLFYVASAVVAASTLLLFLIEEHKNE